MLILSRTACRKVAAFLEFLASPAALTMIRLQHDGGGVTEHQGFTEATDRYTTSLSPRVSRSLYLGSLYFASPRTFSFGRSLASVTVAARIYVPPVCKCSSVKPAIHPRADI